MKSSDSIYRWRIIFEKWIEVPKRGVYGPFTTPLRELTGDQSLYIEEPDESSATISIRSTLDGFARARAARPRSLQGFNIRSIELVVDTEFLAAFSQRVPKLIQIFFDEYNSVFRRAAEWVLKRSAWSPYDEDDLVADIWTAFLDRDSRIFERYTPQEGPLGRWLFVVARNIAVDRLRSNLRQYRRVSPITPPITELHDRVELARLLDRQGDSIKPLDYSDREEMNRFLSVFQEWLAQQDHRLSHGERWNFFVDSFVHGLSEEELARKYRLQLGAIYQRRHRLRKDFQAMWQAFHTPGSVDLRIRQLLRDSRPIDWQQLLNPPSQELEQQNTSRREARLILDVQIEDLDKETIAAIVEDLKTISGDRQLELLGIRRGSSIMMLNGTADAIQKLEEEINSGKRSGIRGFRIIGFSDESSTPESVPDGPTAKQIFYIFAIQDTRYLDELIKHFATLKKKGVIQEWDRRQVSPGAIEWDETSAALSRSDFVLILISPDSLSEEICDKELKQALRQQKGGGCMLVPIRLRPVARSTFPFAMSQSLPDGKKWIIEWKCRDLAWSQIVDTVMAASAMQARQGRMVSEID